METVLTIAVIVTAVAIVVQAGVLLGMYLMSRRLTSDVNGLIHDSRRLMTPLETIAVNFRSASEDLAEISKMTREEAHHMEQLLTETRETIRCEIQDLRTRITSTVEQAKDTVLSPVREWSAVARGVAEGVRVLFGRKQQPEEDTLRESPAA